MIFFILQTEYNKKSHQKNPYIWPFQKIYVTLHKQNSKPLKLPFYILRSYARYYITSWHTGGHHIHSPYLFYIARAILPETARYYCFGDIETAYARHNAHTHLRPYANCKEEQIICRLVNFAKPKTIVADCTRYDTLGAYLACPAAATRILCCDYGSPLNEQDAAFWKTLHLRNITFAKPESIQTATPDFAVIDADNGHAAQTFQMITPLITQKSLCIIRNIRTSQLAHRTWKDMQHAECVTAIMDLGNIGILFFDRHFPKEEYRIRI